MTFTCNICGRGQSVEQELLDRERASCSKCGSNVRYRAIIHHLSVALFGESRKLTDFRGSRSLLGVGFSDWPGFARPLAKTTGYRNTYLHQEPTIDLHRVPEQQRGLYDFAICSEVLEHVPPPIQPAMNGLASLLKPNGVLILTVPYQVGGGTIEHFPTLYRYVWTEIDGLKVLVNRRADGQYEVFNRFEWHGGIGDTIEMRMFGIPDLLANLDLAGLDVAVQQDDYLPFGIHWKHPWSLPIVARKRS